MPQSNFRRKTGIYLAGHRREFKVLAHTGCALCLIRGGLALFGRVHANDRTFIFLIVGFLFLYYCAGEAAAVPFGTPSVKNDPDWLKVPGWFRRAFQPVLIMCLAITAPVGFLHQFTGWPSGAVYHVLVVTGGSIIRLCCTRSPRCSSPAAH